MKIKKGTKIVLLLILPIITAGYFLLCILLYFFEPLDYHEPDLSAHDYCFDIYDNYSYNRDNRFFIKTISYSDVVATSDIRLKYIDNTAIVIAEPHTDFYEVEKLASSLQAEISGYIADADFYQFTFSALSYDELVNICSELETKNIVQSAMPDYFEETPNSDCLSVTRDLKSDFSYHHLMATDAIYNSAHDTSNIKIGMIDSPVDLDSDYLNVVKHDYTADYLYAGSHGTQVAGILSSSLQAESCGVCPGAQVYSYCGLNTSISYWIASLCDMIIHEHVRAINISMGYNAYIPLSAMLGCEFSQAYIADENDLFTAFLANLIENDYDFLICQAAGNDSDKRIYKVQSDCFNYGDKKLLSKVDIFHIFSKYISRCDAKYSLFLSDIQNEKVADHIIIVAACNQDYDISTYSNTGNAVDIAAIGDYIYCLGQNNSYGYASGTSMATPFVTATAAFLYSVDPSLTAGEVKDMILRSSGGIVTDGIDIYHVLNCKKAMEQVK